MMITVFFLYLFFFYREFDSPPPPKKTNKCSTRMVAIANKVSKKDVPQQQVKRVTETKDTNEEEKLAKRTNRKRGRPPKKTGLKLGIKQELLEM